MIDGEDEGKELSLDDILGSAINGDAYDAAQDSAEGAETAAPASGAPASQDNRDPATGRFTAQQKAAADAAAGTARAAGAPNTDQGQTQTAAPGADPASEPPASWSAAEKALWPTLPPDVRAVLARREADFAKGLEQKAQALKPYETLEQVIGPRRQALAATYGSAENAVAQLFKLSDFADQQPAQFAAWFLQSRGLDPRQVFNLPASSGEPQPGNGAEPPANPEIAAIREKQAQLERELEEARYAPFRERAHTDLAKFEADAATKAPHYQNPQVKSEMMQILASARRDISYEEAYEQAVWSIPELRSQLIADREKAAVEAQAKAAAEAAAKAKSAASPRFSSAGAAHAVRAGKGSIDQTMERVWERMEGAA